MFYLLKKKTEEVSNTLQAVTPSQMFERFKLKAHLYEGELDGEIQVSIFGANGLLNKDGGKLSKESDPYVKILLDEEVIGTSTVKSGSNVVWKEYFEKTVKGKFELLTLRVEDKDVGSSSEFLGEVRIAIKDLKKAAKIKANSILEKKLIKEGQTAVSADFQVAGTLNYLVQYFPRTLDGHIKIHIDKANGVKSDDAGGGVGDPYVCVLLDSQQIGQTTVKKNTADPVFNETIHADVSGNFETLYLSLWDSDVGKDDYICHLKIPTSEIIEKKKISGTFNLMKQPSATDDSISLGNLTFDLTYTLPNFLGKVDLKILKATDLLNSDSGLFKDVSDPFAEVLLDDVSVGKTKTIKNNVNPEWNETISFEAKGQHQKLQIIVWDADLMTNDSLGSLKLPINEIVKNKRLAGEFVLAPYKSSPGAGTLSFELVYHPK